MRGRLGRRAVQDPAAVRAALDRAAGDQLAERGGDRRPAGADHPGERAVRQPEADEHAVGHHAPPALGEAPQQGQQPVVDTREVSDRLHHHQPLGAPRGALHERGEDLRPLRRPHRERVVDHRHTCARQRGPAHAARQQDLGIAILPRPQQVTGAEQLGRRMVADRGLADEQPVEHQQPDRLAAGQEHPAGVPRAALDLHRAHGKSRRDLADPAWVKAPRKLRVGLEKLY